MIIEAGLLRCNLDFKRVGCLELLELSCKATAIMTTVVKSYAYAGRS